jgi:hypothetical protein
MDKWRYDVFRGKINESNYNQKWWEMRFDIFLLIIKNCEIAKLILS